MKRSIRWLRIFTVLGIAAVLALIPVSGVSAADNQDITVTATPEFIGIANAPGTWDINGITGSGYIVVDTVYWSNPLGDTTTPTATVVDGECRFTITNTSTVDIDLTVNFPDHTGGDASANSDLGTNSATEFGAYSYFSGELLSSKVIAKSTGSDVALDALTALTNVKWGIEYESQTNAWTTGTAMTSTVNIAATAD